MAAHLDTLSSIPIIKPCCFEQAASISVMPLCFEQEVALAKDGSELNLCPAPVVLLELMLSQQHWGNGSDSRVAPRWKSYPSRV